MEGKKRVVVHVTQIFFLLCLVDRCITIFLCIESTIWRPKSVPIKRAAKTIMLHRCDVENCEDTSATMVEKGEI